MPDTERERERGVVRGVEIIEQFAIKYKRKLTEFVEVL